MSEDLFEYPIKEPWSDYPKAFRPKALQILLALVILVCPAEVLLSFIGISMDARMTSPGLEHLPVPVVISLIVLVILPLPCLAFGLLAGMIPITNVPYRVRFCAFSLFALLPLQLYALKDLIAATIHA